jgi:molybdopterin molybdotransferase
VIRQEDTDYGEDTVSIYRSLAPYQNYCRQGEDYHMGDILLTDRTYMGPVETGILASLGKAEAKVYRRPRVLLMSTGDELIMPGRELSAGKIYDSNLFTLEAMLKE